MERKIGFSSSRALLESLLAPGVPVDRITGMLKQIGALLAGQPVRALALGAQGALDFNFFGIAV